MDSGSLLDLLGNENRRRILRLLARKPCYVTEISEYLSVSPKAVIDHLRRLEEAGIVESEVDDRRRKYFRIARNVRLEVSLSPYGFGTKSAYPASASFDLTRCTHLSIDVRTTDNEDPAGLAADLANLRDLERELSLAQRWVHGQIAERQQDLDEAIPTEADHERVYAEVLVALARNPETTASLTEEVDAPPDLVRSALSVLAERGLVDRQGDRWNVQDHN
jgi:ArsR family transcriptional regulator